MRIGFRSLVAWLVLGVIMIHAHPVFAVKMIKSAREEAHKEKAVAQGSGRSAGPNDSGAPTTTPGDSGKTVEKPQVKPPDAK